MFKTLGEHLFWVRLAALYDVLIATGIAFRRLLKIRYCYTEVSIFGKLLTLGNCLHWFLVGISLLMMRRRRPNKGVNLNFLSLLNTILQSHGQILIWIRLHGAVDYIILSHFSLLNVCIVTLQRHAQLLWNNRVGLVQLNGVSIITLDLIHWVADAVGLVAHVSLDESELAGYLLARFWLGKAFVMVLWPQN